MNSNRWAAGRTPSQQLRHRQWKAPDLTKEPQPSKLARYSSKDYVIGESTQKKLQRIAQRLINGPSPDLATSNQVDQEAEDLRNRLSQAQADTEAHQQRFELDGGAMMWCSPPAELAGTQIERVYLPNPVPLKRVPIHSRPDTNSPCSSSAKTHTVTGLSETSMSPVELPAEDFDLYQDFYDDLFNPPDSPTASPPQVTVTHFDQPSTSSGPSISNNKSLLSVSVDPNDSTLGYPELPKPIRRCYYNPSGRLRSRKYPSVDL